MAPVEWSEILKWVPGTPQAAGDQEPQGPEYHASATLASQAELGRQSPPLDAKS